MRRSRSGRFAAAGAARFARAARPQSRSANSLPRAALALALAAAAPALAQTGSIIFTQNNGTHYVAGEAITPPASRS